MLTVHHLQRSQSERVVWLCEELGIDYDLKLYKRSPMLAPPELAKISPTMSAPVIQDGNITLGESGAIVEYILNKHNPEKKLVIGPDADNYADYLYFFHFANGYFQPSLLRYRAVTSVPNIDKENVSVKLAIRGFETSLKILNERLAKTGAWLAGSEFTAADVMTVTSLTTMRLFVPYSLEGYDGILAYLQRVSQREAFKRAVSKGDPGFEPVIGAEKPTPFGQQPKKL